MVSLKNSDLLGKTIILLNSSDISKINKKGLVIYETKHQITLRTKKGFKKINKKEILKYEIVKCETI